MKEPIRVSADDLRRNFTQILSSLTVPDDISVHVVEGLIQTSLRGVDSHGIRLFPHYVRALKGGRINGQPKMRFEKTGGAVGRLDADHTFGHAAGAFAMAHAIDLAKESGTGAVAVFNSSHCGAAAYFGLIAAERDMIGISMTHADALMLSAGGTRAFFGTNPICVTAPMEGEEPFCLDMATTQWNWNKVKIQREKNAPVPPNLAADAQGNMTTDPHQAASLFPIGDYKGFGLGMVVDIFCGLLTGAPFGRDIKAMFTTPLSEKRYLGQFYMALNIEKFVDLKLFKKRLKTYVDEIRLEPAKMPGKPVMIAGDPEKNAFKERSKNGIPLSLKEYDELKQLEETIIKGSPR